VRWSLLDTELPPGMASCYPGGHVTGWFGPWRTPVRGRPMGRRSLLGAVLSAAECPRVRPGNWTAGARCPGSRASPTGKPTVVERHRPPPGWASARPGSTTARTGRPLEKHAPQLRRRPRPRRPAAVAPMNCHPVLRDTCIRDSRSRVSGGDNPFKTGGCQTDARDSTTAVAEVPAGAIQG
jgi:hypothetical protein